MINLGRDWSEVYDARHHETEDAKALIKVLLV